MSTTPQTEQAGSTPPAAGASVVELTDEALAAADAAHYSMTIEWSDEDEAYLVTLPEWEGRVFGPVTHGDTYEEAVKNGNEVLAMLVKSAQEDGEPLPAPHVFAASTR